MKDKEAPLVSWIVPVYNTARYLSQCLDSITIQTYQHWELLLMDDGSTDESPAICDRYVRQDSRIRVVHKPNSGKSDTMNQAIALAQGEFVGIIDSDDWVAPTFTDVLLQAMQDSGKDAAGCGYLNEFVDETVTDAVCDVQQSYSAAEVIEMLYDRRLYGYLHGRLYKRQLLVESVPSLRRYEDFAVLFQWLAHGNGMVLCPECLYHYRQRGSSIMNSASDYMFGYVPLLEACCHFVREHHLMDEQRNKRMAVKNIVRIAKSIARETRGPEADSRLQDISVTLQRLKPCTNQHSGMHLRLRVWLLMHSVTLFKCAVRLSDLFVTRHQQHRAYFE